MAYITVRATPGNVSKKGEVTSVKVAAVFSRKIRLPNSLRVEVTGATAVQIDSFLDNIKSLVSYSTVNENASGWRVKMEMDPAIVTATGMDAAFRQEVKSFILGTDHDGNWDATQFSQTANELVVDIAKEQPFDLPAIKQEVNAWFQDKLQEALHFHRFFFPDSVVDPRVVQGLIDEPLVEDGEGNLPVDWVHFTITKSQAESAIVDRLV